MAAIADTTVLVTGANLRHWTGSGRGSSEEGPKVIEHKTAADDFNTKVIEEFRANEGRIKGWPSGTLILVHHVGAKSRAERVTPLGCFAQGDGRFAIVASNGGSPTHPDWYYSLEANPRIEVERGAETFTVLAEELDDSSRAELWPTLVTEAPQVGEFQTRIARQIPVFMLTRQG